MGISKKEPDWIVKRDGRKVAFDRRRITMAVYKAGEACDMADWSWAEGVTDRVVEQLPLDRACTVEGVQDLVEEAAVGFVGIQRDEETAEAKEYYRKLPPISGSDKVIVLDPMLATGGSLEETLTALKEEGAQPWFVSWLHRRG